MSAFTSVLLFVYSATPACPQSPNITSVAPVTVSANQIGEVGTIALQIAAADALMKRLQSLGKYYGGVVEEATNNMAARLYDAQRTLQDTARNEINKPINNLGKEVQEASRRFDNTVRRTEDITKSFEIGGYANIHVFLSGMRNVTESLKVFPGSKRGEPRVDYFKFDSSPVAFSVPKAGGRLTLYGYRMWDDVSEPIIILFDESHTIKIAELKPERGGSKDQVSVLIPGSVLEKFAGTSVLIEVARTSQGRTLIGRHRTQPTTTDILVQPMYIPQAYNTQFTVRAWLAYDTRTNQTKELDKKTVTDVNDSLTDPKKGSNTFRWVLPVDGEWEIYDYRKQDSGLNRGDNHSVKITAKDTMVIDYDLAPKVLFIFPPKVEPSYINRDFIPIVKGVVKIQHQVKSTDAIASMDGIETMINLNLPKPEHGDGDVIWFEVIATVGGKPLGGLYVSPKIQPSLTSGTIPVVRTKFFSFEGTYQPKPVSGQSEMNIRITAVPGT